MNNKEKQTRFVHEALIIMGVLVLLCFICRLWPILLLAILGVLIAAIRMVFLSAKIRQTPPRFFGRVAYSQ